LTKIMGRGLMLCKSYVKEEATSCQGKPHV
jgi:hypothetical protein